MPHAFLYKTKTNKHQMKGIIKLPLIAVLNGLTERIQVIRKRKYSKGKVLLKFTSEMDSSGRKWLNE